MGLEKAMVAMSFQIHSSESRSSYFIWSLVESCRITRNFPNSVIFLKRQETAPYLGLNQCAYYW